MTWKFYEHRDGWVGWVWMGVTYQKNVSTSMPLDVKRHTYVANQQ